MTEAETEQVEEDDGEELPEMEAGEFADADLDALAEEVEAEAGASSDDPDPDEESAPDSEEAEGDIGLSGGESWGDMYVGTLTTLSNALIEEHGTPESEPIQEEMARQLHLDAYFDEWMESRGKSDMPPEQALLIGTTMFLVVVVGTKTELPSKLLEEVEF